MNSSTESKKIRVRFAPSPTGPLNLGGARTALFNWLYAKHENGDFILRIEDTDKERSKPEYEKNIKDTLKWLGLKWDEIYKQSDRMDRYKYFLKELFKKNLAYYCFCTEEELESEYEAQMSQGIAPKYSGRCKMLSEDEVKERIKKEKYVIRFKMPEKEISFQDIIRNKVTFDTRLIGDIIIAKNFDEPLYNFANVIDDFEMNITHVVRGEEHISNTPRQIAIQEALEFPKLIYAHLPLILGNDRKKLSKRYLAKSILDYRDDGYLAKTVLNFLVLLGWHLREDKEIMTIEEMTKGFSFERVQKAGAVFNEEKLDWFNGYYIRNMNTDDLCEIIKPFVPESWVSQKEKFNKVVGIEKERIKKLSELKTIGGFFFELPEYESSMLMWKNSQKSEILENLESVHAVLNKIKESSLDAKTLEKELMPLADARGRGNVLWPMRVALSGQMASPGPFELAEILGKEESVKRLHVAIKKIK